MFVVQAEVGIRVLVRARGLGDVYKRQAFTCCDISSRSPVRRRRSNLWVKPAADCARPSMLPGSASRLAANVPPSPPAPAAPSSLALIHI